DDSPPLVGLDVEESCRLDDPGGVHGDVHAPERREAVTDHPGHCVWIGDVTGEGQGGAVSQAELRRHGLRGVHTNIREDDSAVVPREATGARRAYAAACAGDQYDPLVALVLVGHSSPAADRTSVG